MAKIYRAATHDNKKDEYHKFRRQCDKKKV